MPAVTIDNIDIKAHERYAKDQAELDPFFLDEPHLTISHSLIISTSTIYKSELEELLGPAKSSSWAHFCLPPFCSMQANRLFSYCVLPFIFSPFSLEQETDEEEEESPLLQKQHLPKIKKAVKKYTPASAKAPIYLEKDRSSILLLLDKIDELDGMIRHILTRKTQYQKG